eukprot:TRINITY_DN69204_c0_g1_i1.p1 TRINITY_DN69204_c0_g1~~TRINITY_DN69204_c0_g1_i1.p1  ORF type:complete len:314 (-),score=85.29 TRINITY_DN69204_c0_g1_i1:544-1485(-)
MRVLPLSIIFFLFVLAVLCVSPAQAASGSGDAVGEAGAGDDDDDSEETTGEDDDEEEDDEDEDEDEDEDDVMAISTDIFFPDFAVGDSPTGVANKSPRIPAGSMVDAVATVSTMRPTDAVFVIAARGYLQSPFQIKGKETLQNFSLVFFNETLPPQKEHSLWYRFQLAPDLEPRDYNCVLELFYLNSRNETLIHPLFNGTLSVAPPITTYDAKAIGTWLFFLLLVATGGYTAYVTLLLPKQQKSASRANLGLRPNERAPVSRGADDDDEDDEDDEFIPSELRKYRQDRKQMSPGKGSPKGASPKGTASPRKSR